MKKKISYLAICCAIFLSVVPAKSQSLDNSATVVDQSGVPGDVGIPVAVSLSSTVPVTRFRFEITFDGDILTATDVRLAPRTRGFELSGVVGTDNRLYFDAVAPSGKSLPAGSGSIADIFFNVDSSAQPGTETPMSFVPDNCTVWDAFGVPLPSLLLVDGVFTIVSVGIDERKPQIGDLVGYARSYPNPFKNFTTIQYVLPDVRAVGRLSLNIFDQMGRRVAVLTEYTVEGNDRLFRWNGAHDSGDRLPSGVYFYRLRGLDLLDGSYTEARRLVLLR